jgi:hypothetical protein
MTELEEAAQRLEQAVARLEAASRRGGDRKPASRPNPASGDAAATVAARLDDAILRIDRLLES